MPEARVNGRNYTVLLWDRRNAAGASEIAVSEDPWYVITDAEDLTAQLQHLDIGPAQIDEVLSPEPVSNRQGRNATRAGAGPQYI